MTDVAVFRLGPIDDLVVVSLVDENKVSTFTDNVDDGTEEEQSWNVVHSTEVGEQSKTTYTQIGEISLLPC